MPLAPHEHILGPHFQSVNRHEFGELRIVGSAAQHRLQHPDWLRIRIRTRVADTEGEQAHTSVLPDPCVAPRSIQHA